MALPLKVCNSPSLRITLVPEMPSNEPPCLSRLHSSNSGCSPSPETMSNGPVLNINFESKVASMPPATMTASGQASRAAWANPRSNCNVMPVVDTPMTSHREPRKILSKSLRMFCGRKFGSNTSTWTPREARNPCRRHTPRGGARNVNSPQLGS
jgi:hypothetical protein